MEDEEFLKQIGARLRQVRIKKGYPAYDLFAFDHDLPRHNILRAEQGKGTTLKTLNKILKALEISPEEFFKGIK